MAKGLAKSWTWGKRDAGGLDTIIAEVGPETALATMVIRQAVADWQNTQQRPGKNQRLRNELAEFFYGAWFKFMVRQLGLEPEKIVRRIELNAFSIRHRSHFTHWSARSELMRRRNTGSSRERSMLESM